MIEMKTQQNNSNLPNFLVVGGMKAGTTAISINLNFYDDIFIPYTTKVENIAADYIPKNKHLKPIKCIGKEINYFDQNYEHGVDFYRLFFNTNKPIIGESNGNYLYAKGVKQRIVETLGKNIKIVILIRDPLKRSYSHWNHAQQTDYEWAKKFHKPFEDCVYSTYSLVDRSLWHKHIIGWVEVFGYDNIIVSMQEEMLDKPLETHNRIVKFLGAKPKENISQFEIVHKREYSKKFSDDIADKYKNLFSKDVSKLKKMYPDLDYGYWHDY